MPEVAGAGEPLSPAQEACRKFDAVFETFELVKDIPLVNQKRRKVLLDGTELQADRNVYGMRTISCKRTIDTKDPKAYIMLDEEGLWGFRVRNVILKVGEFTLGGGTFEKGFAQGEGDRTAQFKNSAKPVMEWIETLVQQDRFVSPLESLITVA